MATAKAEKTPSLAPEPSPALKAALALEACTAVLKLRVGVTIGAVMTRESLSFAGRRPEAFGPEDIRSFARRILDSASVFLDDDEIGDLSNALDEAIRKHLGDWEGTACSKASM